MSDITEHQSLILHAIADGKKIEGRYIEDKPSGFWDSDKDWHYFPTQKALDALFSDAYELRVKEQ